MRVMLAFIEQLRADAAVMRQYGDDRGADICLRLANMLETALRDEEYELLDLRQAAAESGYSTDHIGRMIRDGKIPNAGRQHAPRVRRRDLPKKPGSESTKGTDGAGKVYDNDGLFRDIASSKFGV